VAFCLLWSPIGVAPLLLRSEGDRRKAPIPTTAAWAFFSGPSSGFFASHSVSMGPYPPTNPPYPTKHPPQPHPQPPTTPPTPTKTPPPPLASCRFSVYSPLLIAVGELVLGTCPLFPRSLLIWTFVRESELPCFSRALRATLSYLLICSRRCVVSFSRDLRDSLMFLPPMLLQGCPRCSLAGGSRLRPSVTHG